jgi:hypothetical protein
LEMNMASMPSQLTWSFKPEPGMKPGCGTLVKFAL